MVQTYINVNGQSVEGSIDRPSSRSFRSAWQLEGGVITVDMTKAREIYRDKLRQERGPLLEALDVQYMRAMEEGSETAAIIAEKKRLRGVTSDKAIDEADTAEQLEALNLI